MNSKARGRLRGNQCRYGQSRLLVRGPQRSLDDPYVAFLGGTEVYGRFVEFPFVDSLQARLGMDCINLGSVNAGLDSFAQDDTLIGVARNARLTVVQMLGAQNISNPYYRVHPRRNDRFLAAQPALKTLYPEVDFTEFHFNKHLLCTLREISAQRFEQVREQLQRSWVDRMTAGWSMSWTAVSCCCGCAMSWTPRPASRRSRCWSTAPWLRRCAPRCRASWKSRPPPLPRRRIFPA